MLGLAVLFFLGLWVVITIVAMVIGWKITKRWGIKSGLFGAFLGFMLTMGGFIVYWTVEYIQIQRTVTHLCETEGGITVYVTPEEWRKQIGEEEWAGLFPFTNQEIRDNGPPKIIEINHQNRIYKYTRGIYRAGNLENSKVALYDYIDRGKYNILKFSKILADRENGNILIKIAYFTFPQSAIANDISGLKFWLNDVANCIGYNENFYDISIQYSNLTKGEKDEKQ